MKKINILIGIVFLCMCLVAGPVFAINSEQLSSTSTASGISSSDNAPLLGNEHYYSVTVKTSGTLVVNAKIILTNNTNKPKAEYTFSGLNGVKGNITGYQQIKGRHCKSPDYTANKCLEFEEPSYSAYSYYDGYDESSTYQPLDPILEGEKLQVKLPTALASYKSTAIVLSYYLSDQTKNGLFGQKKFKFKSLLDQDLIKNISVSVSTDADLYVKGEKSKVSSSQSFDSYSTLATSSINSKSLDSAVSNIGYYGDWMNKTGKDIVPGESFDTSGVYSTTWIGLYWKMLLLFLLIVALVVFGIWWLAKKRRNSSASMTGTNLQTGTPTNTAINSLSFHEAATMKNFLTSFLVAACLILLFIAGAYLFEYILSLAGYNYSMLMTVAGLVLTLLLLGVAIGYPIYLGVRKGLNMAIVAVISYVAAVAIAMIVGAVVIHSFSNNNETTPIRPISNSL